MKKAFLVILDGWGLGADPKIDAIAQANTPFFDQLMKSAPHAELTTYGEAVGLPRGQMGNSEVGHLNIGAGRIVHQDLVKINRALKEQTLFQREVFQEALKILQNSSARLHIMGLASDGGVHSHIDHLLGIVDALKDQSFPTYIHAFTDGRDTDPKSGRGFIEQIEQAIESSDQIQLADVIGRYYAMDRDKRWERTQKAYDLLVHRKGTPTRNFDQRIASSYEEGVTDEFLLPLKNANLGEEAAIAEGDVVLFFNFRSDRPRQITTALTQGVSNGVEMLPVDTHFISMTPYDETFRDVRVLFEKQHLTGTMGEVVSNAGGRQLRIAETEKYPHVTFFFSGGREQPFEKEQRILINSPKVATYDLQPEMSAPEVSQAVMEAIREEVPDFICLNYANPDMVGHTGDFEAVKKAVETVDRCLQANADLALKSGYELLIIADHGNADYMINPDGSPNTAHSKHPVPIIYLNEQKSGEIRSGILADVAPTLLHIMGLQPSKEMTGKSLIQ